MSLFVDIHLIFPFIKTDPVLSLVEFDEEKQQSEWLIEKSDTNLSTSEIKATDLSTRHRIEGNEIPFDCIELFFEEGDMYVVW